MNRLLLVAVSAFCLLPTLSLAQDARVLKDKEAVRFNEIERGFNLSVSGGFWALVNPPADPGGVRPFSVGQTAKVEIGYDIIERLSAHIFIMANANRAGAEYRGQSGNIASGDFSMLVPGAGVKVNIVGFNDSQEVKRTWFYVRGGIGAVIFQPRALLPNIDFMLNVAPGVEYFTRLRHFSIGIEAAFAFLFGSQSIGFAVTPTLRYAF